MVHVGGYYRNSNMDKILSLMADWDAEYFTYKTSTLNTREYYYVKSQIQDPDTTTYTKALSGKNLDEYYKAMYDKITSLIRRETWNVVPSKSVANYIIFSWY